MAYNFPNSSLLRKLNMSKFAVMNGNDIPFPSGISSSATTISKAHPMKDVVDKSTVYRTIQICGTKMKIVKGDITEIPASAIVCPMNNYLEFHGGIARQVREKGGPCIQEEAEYLLKEINFLETGCAEFTRSTGQIPCQYVIHAVGPNVNCPSQLGKDGNLMLTQAINNALKKADQLGCTSLLIPAISTGNHGFDKRKCA